MTYRVKFKNVTKKYKLYTKSLDKLKDLFVQNRDGEYHYALQRVSFEVEDGQVVGIIGLNGSGKSTLSNLIAGVTMPNDGSVEVNGAAALISISNGLNLNLTGLENIELKGLMMGLTKKQIEDITPHVIEFADIGKFMRQPVKTYSSGMRSRLGFAISIHINPDILVIDEALSVGDPTFTNKCLEKINEFKARGKTIFFISHSLSEVQAFCTQALWLHYGEVREYGDVDEVIGHYKEFLQKYNAMTKEERQQLREDQSNQFQHGLLQDTVEIPKRRRSKKKTTIATIASILGVGGILGAAGYKERLFTGEIKEPKPAAAVTTEKAVTVQKNTQSPAISPVPSPLYAITANDVIIRKGANKDSAELAVANFGDIYHLMKQQQDPSKDIVWAQIEMKNGQIGWVSSEWVGQLISSPPLLTDQKLEGLDSIFPNHASWQKISQYYGKTLDELKAMYKEPLHTENSVDGTVTASASDNIQFVIQNQKVQKIVLQNITVDNKLLTEKLGQYILENDSKDAYMYETENYYIKVQMISQTQQPQFISVEKKNAYEK